MRSTAPTSLAGLTVIALCAGLAPSPAPVPASSPGGRKSTLETPYYKVETDDISYKANGDFTMPHKVTFSRPGSDATADHAEGNYKRGTVSLIGNVIVHDNGNAPEANSTDEYAKGGPATLSCDQLDVDSKAKVYTAIGHVHLEQGARTAAADRGVLNRETGNLHLEGNVKTAEGDSTMRAQYIDYDINSRKTKVVGKPIVIKQPIPSPEPGSASPTPKPKKRRTPFGL